MQVTYCELWSDQLRAPSEVMGAEQARARDAAGEPYCVVLGDASAPQAVIEVAWKNSYLGVSFIDEAGRTHTSYDFEKVDESRLFMTEVTVWTYPEGAQFKFEASVIESVEFQPDGYASRTVDDKSSDQVKETEYANVPVDTNWEPVPEFGHWESVARYDRDSHPGA
jgi:hypothetical protein